MNIPAKTPASVPASGPGASPAADFSISLDFFSGPMDLLLHLVHQQEVAIENVSMRLIAEQYLTIISRARLLDLEKASEYLVIAATLLSIKSASLLPSAPALEDPTTEEGSEQFYEELRARLRAYAITKSRARALSAMPQLGVDTFSRIDRRSLQPTPEMLAEPEEVTSLALLFGRLLKRIGGALNSYRIRLEPISVVSFMMKIVDTLGQKDSPGADVPPIEGSFRALVRKFRSLAAAENAPDKKPTGASDAPEGEDRSVVIGSFIAVLELVKRGFLQAFQNSDREDIRLELALAEYGGQSSEMSSEFDETPDAAASNIVQFPTPAPAVAEELEEEVVVLKEANTRGDY